MKFDETEIVAAGMIGFDMIEGPNVKWYKEFRDNIDFSIDMESFLMNFYLSFRGGDDELQPVAILYQGFYVTAFPRGLELCCLFMKPDNLNMKIQRLSSIANELVNQMDEQEEIDAEFGEMDSDREDQEEIKRIVINLLNNQEISTPELRRYFHLSNSEIWSIMSQLEREEKVIRTQKIGRSQYWTAIGA